MLFRVIAIGALVLAPASDPPNFSYGPESRIWVEGTSTLRSFTCSSRRIEGSVVSHPVTRIEDLQQAVQRVELSIPAATLDCLNSTMNDHMLKALDARAHPLIRYVHGSHDVTTRDSGAATVRMIGELTIAGRTNPVSLEAVVTEQSNGSLRARGSKQLRMTEFGMHPPSLMLGTLKVRDAVTIHFDLVLTR